MAWSHELYRTILKYFEQTYSPNYSVYLSPVRTESNVELEFFQINFHVNQYLLKDTE